MQTPPTSFMSGFKFIAKTIRLITVFGGWLRGWWHAAPTRSDSWCYCCSSKSDNKWNLAAWWAPLNVWFMARKCVQITAHPSKPQQCTERSLKISVLRQRRHEQKVGREVLKQMFRKTSTRSKMETWGKFRAEAVASWNPTAGTPKLVGGEHGGCW